MKHTLRISSILIALTLLATLVGPAFADGSFVIPTITILSVKPGLSVTIQTNNYPANDNFDVLMNTFGTLGVGGTKVISVNSGTGGTQTFTFVIPDSLKNEAYIAIRLQSPTSGLYSYNWFTNQGSIVTPPTPPGPPAPYLLPTFAIVSIDPGKTVAIQTNNFPANDNFDVLMNTIGTLGIGGTKITSVSSGTGGTLSFTFTIPDGLKSQAQIAIRLQSPTSGYYSYNWFWNTTGGTPVNPPPPGLIPTFSIQSVVKDTSVTILTKNFPANDNFDVYMGRIGTEGKGGVKVTSVSSDKGGALTFTFTIPDSLKGLGQIAIRLQSPTSGYFSYNWFWNNN